MDTYENEELVQAQSPVETENVAAEVEQTEDFEIIIYEDEEQPPVQAAEEPIAVLPEADYQAEKKPVKRVTAMALVIAVLISSVASALLVSFFFEQKLAQSNQLTQYYLDSMNKQLEDLQQQIKDNSFTGNGNSVSGTPNQTPDGSLTPGQVYAQNVKAVVAISNQATTTNIYGQVTESASSGSGFIISSDGYVVTNYHVAEGATKLTVILHDGKEYAARLVGYDAGNDVALLKVEATDLPCVKLGKSSDLIVGDQVVAIGNPLGELTNSLTVGYVSALERDIKTGGARINMIQTDVAINSGNSGGPLFNMKGEVVGITTAKYSGTSNSGATIEGISFAIPFDDVRKKVTDLMEYGYLRGAYLGISVSDDTSGEGALVREVTVGSCAAKGGLLAGDVIQSLGGYPVTSMNDLGRALEHFSAGDTVQMEVLRKGQTVLLTLTLDERPKTTNTDVTEPTTPSTPTETTSPVPQNGTMEQWWEFFFGNGK